MNDRQQRMFEGYKDLDPDLVVLGTYRDNPVIYTKLTRWGSEIRHVVILHKNGNPGDMPKSWEHWNFAPSPDLPHPTRAAIIINEYFDRVGR